MMAYSTSVVEVPRSDLQSLETDKGECRVESLRILSWLTVITVALVSSGVIQYSLRVRHALEREKILMQTRVVLGRPPNTWRRLIVACIGLTCLALGCVMEIFPHTDEYAHSAVL